VCTLVAVFSFVLLFALHQPIIGAVVFLLFHLGGAGVREHSRFAATIIFVYYVVDTLASFKSFLGSPGSIVLRVIIAALLLSNLRATWIAARWRSGSDEAALPLRLDDTWADKLANKWPSWVWPKIRVVYYVFSIGFLVLVSFGLVVMALRDMRQ
jgi:hypothetical protein